jgi:hypothetical protein
MTTSAFKDLIKTRHNQGNPVSIYQSFSIAATDVTRASPSVFCQEIIIELFFPLQTDFQIHTGWYSTGILGIFHAKFSFTVAQCSGSGIRSFFYPLDPGLNFFFSSGSGMNYLFDWGCTGYPAGRIIRPFFDIRYPAEYQIALPDIKLFI